LKSQKQSNVTVQSILNISIWATFTKFIIFTFRFTAVQSEAGKLYYREHRLVEANTRNWRQNKQTT